MADKLTADVNLSSPVLQADKGYPAQFSALNNYLVKVEDSKLYVMVGLGTGKPYWLLVENEKPKA